MPSGWWPRSRRCGACRPAGHLAGLLDRRLACLPCLQSLLDDLSSAGAGPVIGLVYLGLVPTALAFSTWAYALARTDAGRLGVSTYLVPPLTIGLGWALLGERPAALAVLGGLICLTGVALARWKR